MRILLHANVHRPLAHGDHRAGVEIAASPDTAGQPEPWTWSITLLADEEDDPPDLHVDAPLSASAVVNGRAGLLRSELDAECGFRVLEVRTDPQVVLADVENFGVTGVHHLDRDERELDVLIGVTGVAWAEDRHRLTPGDAMVLAGDDPLRLTLSATTADSSVVLVRLHPAGSGSVGWVP